MSFFGVSMAPVELTATPRSHQVLFYDSDSAMVAAVADYVESGLSTGEPVLAIATAAHLAAIDSALGSRGTDVPLVRASGAYLVLDAAQTLESFMVDGSPDANRFTTVLGGVLDAARGGELGVRAFGEMVALLWRDGNVAAAIAVESLWNDLAASRQFSLLCSYPTTALETAELRDVNGVCDLHSTVSPHSAHATTASDAGAASPNSSAVFIAVPGAVAEARRFIRATLTSWGQHRLLQDGTLIVSELATNAITHGDSAFRVSIERTATVVRIAVEDAGPGIPHPRHLPIDVPNGRGMRMVEMLARRWGCDLLDGGKVLWADLNIGSPEPR